MSARKASSVSRLNRKQVGNSSADQSKAERRLADAKLQALIDKFAPTQLRLIGTLRGSLRKRLPSAHEVVYEYRDSVVISFSPNAHGYEGVFSIKAGGNLVKLYFNRGKDLSDPTKLLKGSGTVVRSIDIDSASTLKLPEVVRLMDEAIALNPIPFDVVGSGSIVFRSKASK